MPRDMTAYICVAVSGGLLLFLIVLLYRSLRLGRISNNWNSRYRRQQPLAYWWGIALLLMVLAMAARLFIASISRLRS